MPIFYYHPENIVSKKLMDLTNSRGFLYDNRGVLEIKLQQQIAQAGYDLWPTFHTVLGTLAGSIVKHLGQQADALNPDDELDRLTIKLCHSSPTPWSWVKVLNGPKMNCVIGYCSTPATSPHSMSAVEMAKRGIIATNFVPSAQ